MSVIRIYECTAGCKRQENRTKVPASMGTDDDSARAVGWRIGVNGQGDRQEICPECSGVDEEYWDRRTLTTAYAAGIDAGNTAWGAS
jgi:hypothetical protein